jgi:hypothetical protein
MVVIHVGHAEAREMGMVLFVCLINFWLCIKKCKIYNGVAYVEIGRGPSCIFY